MIMYASEPDIDALYTRILSRVPNTKLTKFPSGAFMMYVPIGDEVWVVEYLHSRGWWGVSRQSTAVFGFEGFENSFENLEETERFVINLLEDA